MAKSKKKKSAKAYKKFKHFIAHLDAHEEFQGVVTGAQRKAKWSGYAVALGAVESIAAEGKSGKKISKRKRQTIKYLHKLAKHAGGAKAVQPPETVATNQAQKPDEVETGADNVVSLLVAREGVSGVGSGDEKPPVGLNTPRNGVADDLQMVAGIGPKLEQLLNGLGIFHFDQIATWTPQEVMWVDEHLRFSGRITREDWIRQAAALAKGGRDEYVRVFGKEPR
ncbi:MAG: hypothetical protein WA921_01435 [Ahrensia sp.]